MSIEDKTSAPTGFEFVDGVCKNPERVRVPMPRASSQVGGMVLCFLLVAQAPAGGWQSGFIIGGGKIKYLEVPVVLGAPGRGDTRDEAIAIGAAGLEALLDAETEGACIAALRDFIRGEKVEEGRDETPAVAGESSKDQAPSTSESAPVVLPGMAHEVNEHGVFVEPEEVVVPMPKKAHCIIRLALSTHGKWAVGVDLKLPTKGQSGAPMLKDAVHETRVRVLLIGLERAQRFFAGEGLSAAEAKIAEKCLAAVDQFIHEVLVVDVDVSEQTVPVVTPTALPPAAGLRRYTTEFAEVGVGQIQRNPHNHRRHFAAAPMHELAESIRLEGLHQPVAVRRLLAGEVPDGELALGESGAAEFELIFGERRCRAARIAGLAAVPARIYQGLTRAQASSIALIENLQREDINALEAAEGFAQLMSDEGLDQAGCAQRVGKERSTVANALGLLRLPLTVRELIREGRLTLGHGKGLLRFVPTEAEAAAWSEAVPQWAAIVEAMATAAVEEQTPTRALEKGVPFAAMLAKRGLAVLIGAWSPHQVGAELHKHPAYRAMGDGTWICLNPTHWAAVVAESNRIAADKAAAEEQRRAAETAALTKGGRKQLSLADLNPADYRELSAVNEGLLALVPAAKQAPAKGEHGRTTVVTDVELADGLKKQMQKAIRQNREEAIDLLEQRVHKALAKLKRVGPRELAWLVFALVDGAHRAVALHLTAAHGEQAGVVLPKGAYEETSDGAAVPQDAIAQHKRLTALAGAEGGALCRALIVERLPAVLQEVLTHGPATTGGTLLKWWLETDTLWLLEETAEGREQLVEQVKASPWYVKTQSAAAA